MARGSNGGGTAVAQRPEGSDPKAVRELLERSADRIAAAIPEHFTAERVIQVVTTLVYRTPRLQECDRNSIYAAVMRGSSLGLDFEPALGEAWLIPRYNKNIRGYECQFQPGYQGLRKLATRGGEVSFIQSRLVHERDVFDYEYVPELVFKHKPHLGRDKGAVLFVYSLGRLKGCQEPLIEVMDTEEIEGIHQRSESYQTAQRKGEPEYGPWVSDWGEMAKKTVLKRLCKSLPRSLELAKAIEADDEEYTGGDRVIVTQGRPSGRALGNAGVLAALGAPDEEPAFEPGTSGQITTEADEQAFEDAIERGEV
jgi:recombination protein RecT